ncbi:SMP-30/gluconolactonase/LRE family protein [Sphingomonas ginkgonis]|uniref:SMP-30/gluconolactonase/LRE family protein n=1 Tax=Sphingomonas ginkgonis TaxID=2315330 RepID=A0A429VB05_9SPHN|nr:SMP-30/gluconolactonase/LRE family protein [Sphingomonas ginkgonis]RST31128.1 SMP-30/gluconolactonase/LRE family protein [Sphingomonas ginkgonis]
MEWRCIAEGLRFPEGPVACADGSVILVEIAAGRVTRVSSNGDRQMIAETGGGPNGLAWGPGGLLYCCNNGGMRWHEDEAGRLAPVGTPDDYAGGSIQTVDPATGDVLTLYASTPEVPLRGPNDLVFDAHGGFWFTDHGKTFARSRDRCGVFYARTDGSFIEEVIAPFGDPNGIGLSPDGTTLYVADTTSCMLLAFTVEAPGRIAPHSRRMLYRPAGQRWFDSLGVEDNGRICVATIGDCGISVVEPAGGLAEFVATDDIYTTNIAWGGADRRTAYVTASGTGRLLAADWPRAGLRLQHEQQQG